MCLSKLQQFEPNGKGYKVFLTRPLPSNPLGLVSPFFGQTIYQIGKTYKAKAYNVMNLLGEIYEAGFHIFEEKKDAKDYAESLGYINAQIHEVSYKKVLVTGFEDGRKCVVASIMTILPKEKTSIIERIKSIFKR